MSKKISETLGASSKLRTHLITVDFDGTISSDFKNLNPYNAKVLSELVSDRHKHLLCIATGRNLQSTLPFAQQITKNAFLITYNGARIDIPGGRSWRFPISNKIGKKIIESLRVSGFEPTNVMIDRDFESFSDFDLKNRIISTSGDVYYREIFFNGNPHTEASDIDNAFNLLKNDDLFQLVLEFPFDKYKNLEIEKILERDFNSSIYFYSGYKMKAMNPEDTILVDDPTKWIIKIRSFNADKAKALSILCHYVNISPKSSRVMTFGNDINDAGMMTFGNSVAMLDSKNGVEKIANSVTKKTSKDNGVAHHLISYFDLIIPKIA